MNIRSRCGAVWLLTYVDHIRIHGSDRVFFAPGVQSTGERRGVPSQSNHLLRHPDAGRINLSGAVGDHATVRFAIQEPVAQFVGLYSHILCDAESVSFVAES